MEVYKMETIVVIEKSDNGFRAYTPGLRSTIIGEGSTVEETKRDFEISCREVYQSFFDKNIPLPEEFIGLTFRYELSLRMVLKPKKRFLADQLNLNRLKLSPIQWRGLAKAMDRYAEHYFEVTNRFISVQEKLPITFESGNFDGQRSKFVLVKKSDGSYSVARLYHGILDGEEFNDWYNEEGRKIIVTHWQEIK